MPTNLPPEYFSAEERFKQAKSYAEKIAALEALIATVPKHKGTDKLRADLRRKLSNLREESTKKTKTSRTLLYHVEKQGASTCALVGFPNTGKSSILASLTNANPVIADYPISTLTPISGMMPFEDILIQIVDLPPIGNESTDGWVSAILRQSDLLAVVVDISEDPAIQLQLVEEELQKWRIPLLKNDSFLINAKPTVVIANKSDLLSLFKDKFEELKILVEGVFPFVSISTKSKEGLEDLRWQLFTNSHIIRVYSKEPGKEPDLHTPFVLPEGSTVLDLAERIHKDFVQRFKYACVWGSARFAGQRVQKDYQMKDRDIVEIHLK